MYTGESRDSDVELVCVIPGAPEVKRSLAEPDDDMSVPDGDVFTCESQDASEFRFERLFSILSRPRVFVGFGRMPIRGIPLHDCVLFCKDQVPGLFLYLIPRDEETRRPKSVLGTLCLDRTSYNIMSVIFTEDVTSAGVLEYVHGLGENCTEMDCLLHVVSGLATDNCIKRVEDFLGKLGPSVRSVMSFQPDETGEFYRFEWMIEKPHRRFQLSMECENRVGRPPLPARASR